MTQQRGPTLPRALFIATVLAMLLFGGFVFAFNRYTNTLSQQKAAVDSRAHSLQAEIETLQAQRLVSKVVEQQVPYPITTVESREIGPFGMRAAFPTVRIEMRKVPTTIQVEDPAVRARLDGAAAELKTLSAKAVATGEKRDRAEALMKSSRSLMAPFLSLVVAAASIFVILSKSYGADSEKWAFGSIGTLLGFWLK